MRRGRKRRKRRKKERHGEEVKEEENGIDLVSNKTEIEAGY